jgi:epoxyqueuosine reductase
MAVDLKTVKHTMADFCLHNPLNVVKELDSMRIYDEPLVGVAKVDDPLFEKLKESGIVGPNHLSPKEWLAGGTVVIAYFLPFTKRVREANRTMGLPVREWLYGRIEGEQFNVALRTFMVRWFLDASHDAVSPTLDGRFKVINRISNWSERHVAYIAGLGTFSLSCSLITKQGSAGRLGSLIVNADLETTPRYYQVKDENCTRCGACILRCPPLAITEGGKDHAVCSEYLDRVLARYRPRYGCGKCQTGVPCEDRIPKSKNL